jgi:regulator of sigma E protease
MTIILFLLVLAILIFVHELGHFLVARACGIRVDAFALGFGPKLFGKTVGETTYSLNLIPFGGYVKIFGENPDEESINGKDKSRSFVHKPKWQQAGVLSAGVFFNFVFAAIIVAVAFIFGVPASSDSYPEYSDRMSNSHIAITFVTPGSPADIAGLKAGDTLKVDSVDTLQKKINESRENGISINFIRNEVASSTIVVAKQGIVPDKYAIGIAMDNVATLRLPIHLAIIEGVRFTLHSIIQTVIGLFNLIVGAFTGTSNMSSVTGPVGIAGMVGDAAKLGFSYLLMFTAMISINLGVLNLIPFPALDGGRILFVLIEVIIRRPIKPAISNYINTGGFLLLIGLMLFVTYKDIINLIVK